MLRCLAVRILIGLYALAMLIRAVVFGLHPDAPRLAMYPVCTRAGDTRCASPPGAGTAP